MARPPEPSDRAAACLRAARATLRRRWRCGRTRHPRSRAGGRLRPSRRRRRPCSPSTRVKRLGEGMGALGEGGHLEDAHRAVPEDGLGVGELAGEQLPGRRPDVETHAVGGDRVSGDDLMVGVGARSAVAATTSTGRTISTPRCSASARNPRTVSSWSASSSELADLVALGLEEGVAHAAADEQAVDAAEQVGDDAELVGDLGAAEDDDVGPLRLLGELREDLRSRRRPDRPATCGSRCGDVVDAGVLAVHGTEAVADVRIGERRRGRSAKAPRSASSLLVSPGSKRRFSSSATSPSSRPATADCASSPTVSVAKRRPACRAAPRAARRPAPGRTAGSGAPLGRPRWAQTTTRAPASTSALRVGRLARIRPSSVIDREPSAPSASGHVEVRPDEDAATGYARRR